MRTLRLSAIPVLLLVVFILVMGFWFCGHRTLQRAYSPSRRYLAEVDEFDCGAVSGFDTDVMLRTSPFAISTPYLRTASDVFYLDGAPSHVILEWTSDTNLNVKCMGCKERRLKTFENKWKQVSIHYVLQ